MTEYWSWILTIVGLTGFVLAGKKVWWCWYINIACQGLWMTYAIVTQQWGFIVAALAYTFVFTKNAVSWTRDHRQKNYELGFESLARSGVLTPNEIREIKADKITTGTIEAKTVKSSRFDYGVDHAKLYLPGEDKPVRMEDFFSVPEISCRVMETRRCEKLVDGELIPRSVECPAGKCFRFERSQAEEE